MDPAVKINLGMGKESILLPQNWREPINSQPAGTFDEMLKQFNEPTNGFRVSSVRRNLEWGGRNLKWGAGNLENLGITKIRMKIFPPRISPIFLSKIRWRAKNKVFTHI